MPEESDLAAAANPQLSDAEAAAVMVMLLGEEQASGILAQFAPGELQLLGEKMCEIGDIGPETIVHAISGFVEHTEKLGINADGRLDHVRRLMTSAVGEVKAENIIARFMPDAPPATALEMARWLNAPAIVPMIRDEHPQVIAVLLVQLEAEIAAQVLQALPNPIQTQVVHRIATMGPVSPEALVMLEELLSRRIAEQQGSAGLRLGGTRGAADLINSSGKTIEKRVLPEIARMDKQLAKQIEAEMFKFEHLFVLDAQAMGSLLREVDSEILINALKGTEPDQREVFFRAMSSRAADGVRDEIAARGRLKMADVIEAQKEIVAVARRLSSEGVIAFGAGGDDEYV